MIFRITHVDENWKCRQFLKSFGSAASAASWAELCFGPARFMSTICLRGRS